MPSLSSVLPLITGASGALVVLTIGLTLFIFGKIKSKDAYDFVVGQMKEARIERDAWKEAYDQERQARQSEHDALVIANDRAEAAVESARTTQKLLDYIATGQQSSPQRRRGDGPAKAQARER